ncbi:hypothetical protein HK102_000298, partial [Quaeritorhiza haematococci]
MSPEDKPVDFETFTTSTTAERSLRRSASPFSNRTLSLNHPASTGAANVNVPSYYPLRPTRSAKKRIVAPTPIQTVGVWGPSPLGSASINGLEVQAANIVNSVSDGGSSEGKFNRDRSDTPSSLSSTSSTSSGRVRRMPEHSYSQDGSDVQMSDVLGANSKDKDHADKKQPERPVTGRVRRASSGSLRINTSTSSLARSSSSTTRDVNMQLDSQKSASEDGPLSGSSIQGVSSM